MRSATTRFTFSVVVLLCVSANGFAQRMTSRWTGTWSVAPQQGTFDPHTDFGGFGQKTLRQSFRVSIGGSKVRIRLSNLFGVAPLTVRDVHIALAASDQAIILNSDKAVTFQHRTSVVIPAGECIGEASL
jgi:hypothetical protein